MDKSLKLFETAKHIARTINPAAICQLYPEIHDGRHYWQACVNFPYSGNYNPHHWFEGKTPTETIRKLIAFLKLESKNKIAILQMQIKDLQKILQSN